MSALPPFQKRILLLLPLVAIGCGDKGKPVDTGGPSSDVEVYINEFMSDNATVLEDNLTFPDCVELYNAGSAKADLSGFWMTDNLDNIFKWQIPDGITIGPGEYIVIFADDDPDEGDFHASFQLDQAGGEDIGLFGPNVEDNPMIDSVEDYAILLEDESLARQPDGTGNWSTDDTPTPGASNG